MKELLKRLRASSSIQEKISFLDVYPPVQSFLQNNPSALQGFSKEKELAGKQLIAIGQWERLVGNGNLPKEAVGLLLDKMAALDAFYQELGGILGYQEKVLQFLKGEEDAQNKEILTLHPPSFIDISKMTDKVRSSILAGIKALPLIAEMYPLGGAADRLHLVDERTGSDLPAAKLQYAGRTLFEGLIRDLTAREYLYFKLYGKQLETPIAIMTSAEKENHAHVLKIAEEMGWFGRPKELFRIFMQPLVPAVDEEGNWCLLGAGVPLLKPGGHGALWKLACDQGVLEWLDTLERKKTLVRQLNNPIASLDYGLLAFSGIGVEEEMVFGFASCPRRVQSAEGVNVIVEKKNGEVALTNIEYCDFAKYGIEDRPREIGGLYSQFSSNTNILFADLNAIARAVKICPFPGLLVNLKQASYMTLAGEKKSAVMARLESTMQNIADVFVEKIEDLKEGQGGLRHTFVTYNHRHKTIATAKKAFVLGHSTQETPEECFYVQMEAAYELLANHCHWDLPAKRLLGEYLEKGPEIFFLYHPALGPLYSLIEQKIRKGRMHFGSEMQLEIADLEMDGLDLEGSLRIEALQPLGAKDRQGIVRYSDRTGRCILRNVKIRNSGVDWEKSSPFWKNALIRKESVHIRLQGLSELIIEDVVLQGSHFFDVPNGVRMRVLEKDGVLRVEKEPLEETPFWNYRINERQEILAARYSKKP